MSNFHKNIVHYYFVLHENLFRKQESPDLLVKKATNYAFLCFDKEHYLSSEMARHGNKEYLVGINLLNVETYYARLVFFSLSVN